MPKNALAKLKQNVKEAAKRSRARAKSVAMNERVVRHGAAVVTGAALGGAQKARVLPSAFAGVPIKPLLAIALSVGEAMTKGATSAALGGAAHAVEGVYGYKAVVDGSIVAGD